MYVKTQYFSAGHFLKYLMVIVNFFLALMSLIAGWLKLLLITTLPLP